MSPEEAFAAVGGWFACAEVVALIDPRRGSAAGASAAVEASVVEAGEVVAVVETSAAVEASVEAGEIVAVVGASAAGEAFAVGEASVVVKGSAAERDEASAGASVAASAPLVWTDHDVHSHHSIPEIPTLPASTVSPILLRLYAWMSFQTWKESQHPPGPGRPGCQARCPPTSRIPPATWRTRPDGPLRSSLRIPTSARIADPISGASWTPARRLWRSFLGYRALSWSQRKILVKGSGGWLLRDFARKKAFFVISNSSIIR